jgi:putative transposase
MILTRATYKYQMYQNDSDNKKLHQQIDVAGIIWNHAIALHKRYFQMYNKHLNKFQLQKHLAKLRRTSKPEWKLVNSQSIQDICDRIERSYKLFFSNIKKGVKASPPSFRKVKKYRSVTYKTSGWKYSGSNEIKITGRKFRFHKSREINGKIKTVTLKRDKLGKLWLYFSVEELRDEVPTTGKSAGYDFGLKTFLTSSNGEQIKAPEPLKSELSKLQRLSRNLSRKKKGSNNRKKALKTLQKQHQRIANIRKDFHFKTARKLLTENDVIFFETLNLDGMKRLWGRKVSDLGFYSFTEVCESQAKKYGCKVMYISKWEPSTKTCSACGHTQELGLQDRMFDCGSCGNFLDRDYNAALNIQRVGASTLGLEVVRQPDSAPVADLGAFFV